MPTELPLNAGTLPSPYTCWQTLYELMFSLGSADGPTLTGLLIQDATPAAEDHDKGWIPTAGGVPRFPGYVFVWHATLGHWVSRNYIASNDASRRIYVGTSASVATYDGGDAGAPGPASGPMWEIDTAFNGSVPIGVGLIPGTAPAANILAPLDTQDSLGNTGAYQVTLTDNQIPDHEHFAGAYGNTIGVGENDAALPKIDQQPVTAYDYWYLHTSLSGEGSANLAQVNWKTLGMTGASATAPGGHNNMQPYVGVYFLKRTARAFYVAA